MKIGDKFILVKQQQVIEIVNIKDNGTTLLVIFDGGPPGSFRFPVEVVLKLLEIGKLVPYTELAKELYDED